MECLNFKQSRGQDKTSATRTEAAQNSDSENIYKPMRKKTCTELRNGTPTPHRLAYNGYK